MTNIKPDTICRIVNYPPANNALVRTIQFDSLGCEWRCEALQHIGGLWDRGGDVPQPATAEPGQEVDVPPEYLQPLYDGDADDEMLAIAGKPGQTLEAA